jgi:hypothetical protein
MAYVDQSSAFGFGTKLTSTQMQNLRDNLDAAFAKDSGAPVLANDYIVADMVGSGQITNVKILDTTIRGTKIDVTNFSIGNFTVNSGLTQVISAGIWNLVCPDDYVTFQINAAGWKPTTAIGNIGGIVFSDGTNMRVWNTGGVLSTVTYQVFG